jgi:two-component system CheB/CheR fusion protein
MFQMFGQLETAVSGSREGLGVGLALARELTVMHGGTIEVHSDGPGSGSEFVVRLPALPEEHAEEVTEAPSRAGEEPVSEGMRVLVVDDSADSARSLGSLLELLGHEVEVAHGGPEALEIVASRPPEVAVLDIGMPGMDGFELARRLRERFPPEELLLVAVTGWGKDEDRRRSREAGFDHHLVKPARPADLQQLLVRFKSQRST